MKESSLVQMMAAFHPSILTNNYMIMLSLMSAMYNKKR
jgi:hypothetical protein